VTDEEFEKLAEELGQAHEVVKRLQAQWCLDSADGRQLLKALAYLGRWKEAA
jgi:hypothetical protein